MDAVVGLVVLVAIVWVVRAAMSGSGSAPRQQSSRGQDPTPPTRPHPTPRTDQAERRRQDRADEAFVDGVLFAHHFDPFGRHDDTPDDADRSAAYWDDDLDGWDDGWDEDDVFHDDAGDW